MNTSRYPIITLILLSLALPITSIAADLPFTDPAPDTESAAAVQLLMQKNILQGNPDGTFGWKDQLNRAAFTTIIMRLTGDVPPSVHTPCFPDVSIGAWYAPSVCAAKSRGIIRGNPNPLLAENQWPFAPERSVQYEEAVKILVELSELETDSLREGEAWYTPYIRFAQEHGLGLTTAETGTQLTRAQMSILTANFLTYTTSLSEQDNESSDQPEETEKQEDNTSTKQSQIYSGNVQTVDVNGKKYKVFPIGGDGHPISTDEHWNECVRKISFWAEPDCKQHNLERLSNGALKTIHPDFGFPFEYDNGLYKIKNENFIPRVSPVAEEQEQKRKEILEQVQFAEMNGQYLYSLPRSADGIPVSSYDTWNSCIRSLYADGYDALPPSCEVYAGSSADGWNLLWYHPDLNNFFDPVKDKQDRMPSRFLLNDIGLAKMIFDVYSDYISKPLPDLSGGTVLPGSTFIAGQFSGRNEYISLHGGGGGSYYYPLHVEKIGIRFALMQYPIERVRLLMPDGGVIGEMQKDALAYGEYSLNVNSAATLVQYGAYYNVLVEITLADEASEKSEDTPQIKLNHVEVTVDRNWTVSLATKTLRMTDNVPTFEVQN